MTSVSSSSHTSSILTANKKEAELKSYPAPYKKRRYYTPDEVKAHSLANDCWVSFFNEVYDLTELIQKNYSKLVEPIIKNAGEDITHWFDQETKDVSKFTNLQIFNNLKIFTIFSA